VTAAGALDLWEAGLTLMPAARAVVLLEAAGHTDTTSWSVGKRDQALLQSYCSAGGSLAAVTECPTCGTTLDVLLDSQELTSQAMLNVSGPDPAEIAVDVDGYHVVAGVPTAGDLERLDPHASPDELAARLLGLCIVDATRHGVAVDSARLPADVVAAVEDALDDADPAADIRFTLSCLECGTEWTEPLDPVRFAWMAVEDDARRLATDVLALAHAYGWSEQEILALSAFRRHLYLSAVRP
jgi:hypothetical protein